MIMANKLEEFLKQSGTVGEFSPELVERTERSIARSREKQRALGDIDFSFLKNQLQNRAQQTELQLQSAISQMNAQERAEFMSTLTNAASLFATLLAPKIKGLFGKNTPAKGQTFGIDYTGRTGDLA